MQVKTRLDLAVMNAEAKTDPEGNCSKVSSPRHSLTSPDADDNDDDDDDDDDD